MSEVARPRFFCAIRRGFFKYLLPLAWQAEYFQLFYICRCRGRALLSFVLHKRVTRESNLRGVSAMRSFPLNRFLGIVLLRLKRMIRPAAAAAKLNNKSY